MLIRSVLILGLLLAVGCRTPDEPQAVPELLFEPESVEDLRPLGAFLQIATDRPIEAPEGRYAYVGEAGRFVLADCSSGEPLCEPGVPCFGWVEFEFELSRDGGVESPVPVASCPYPVAVEPMLRDLKAWRFREPPAVPDVRFLSRTLVGYPFGYGT